MPQNYQRPPPVPTLKEMDAVTWQALTDADRLAIME